MIFLACRTAGYLLLFVSKMQNNGWRLQKKRIFFEKMVMLPIDCSPIAVTKAA